MAAFAVIVYFSNVFTELLPNTPQRKIYNKMEKKREKKVVCFPIIRSCISFFNETEMVKVWFIFDTDSKYIRKIKILKALKQNNLDM